MKRQRKDRDFSKVVGVLIGNNIVKRVIWVETLERQIQLTLGSEGITHAWEKKIISLPFST